MGCGVSVGGGSSAPSLSSPPEVLSSSSLPIASETHGENHTYGIGGGLRVTDFDVPIALSDGTMYSVRVHTDADALACIRSILVASVGVPTTSSLFPLLEGALRLFVTRSAGMSTAGESSSRLSLSCPHDWPLLPATHPASTMVSESVGTDRSTGYYLSHRERWDHVSSLFQQKAKFVLRPWLKARWMKLDEILSLFSTLDSKVDQSDFDEAINNRSSSNTIDAFVEFWTSIRIGDWIHRCSSDFPRAEFSSALSIAALYVSVDACRLGIHAHSTSEEWSHAKPGYDTSYLQLVDWNTIEQKISDNFNAYIPLRFFSDVIDKKETIVSNLVSRAKFFIEEASISVPDRLCSSNTRSSVQSSSVTSFDVLFSLRCHLIREIERLDDSRFTYWLCTVPEDVQSVHNFPESVYFGISWEEVIICKSNEDLGYAELICSYRLDEVTPISRSGGFSIELRPPTANREKSINRLSVDEEITLLNPWFMEILDLWKEYLRFIESVRVIAGREGVVQKVLRRR